MKYIYVLEIYSMSNKFKLYIIKNYLSLFKINLNSYLKYNNEYKKCMKINLS